MRSLVPLGQILLASLIVLVSTYRSAPANAQPASVQPPPNAYVVDDADEAPQDVAVGVDGDTYADTDPSALTDFRSTLDPHGTWEDDPTYGQLWVPSADEVGSDFAPYVSAGSWAYEDDYVWLSSYDWGWIPFHYGRWAWTSGHWGWVPGRTYAGAWVSWRTGADGYGYVGWGPMAPSFGWRSGTAFTLGTAIASRPGPTVFVGRDELFSSRVGARVLVGDRVAPVASGTHPYVRVESVATGRGAPQAVMHGPSPTTLGISLAAVAHVDPSNPNVSRARAFARPSTARALGAHGPVAHTVRRRGTGPEGGGGRNVAGSPTRSAAGGARSAGHGRR